MFDWVLTIQCFFLLLLSSEAVTWNISRMFSVWLVFYLSVSNRNFLFRSKRIMFKTYLNLTMWNQNGINKVVLGSLLLTQEIITRIVTASTSDNDHEPNTIGKEVDPVTSLTVHQKDRSNNLVKKEKKKYARKDYCSNLQQTFIIRNLHCRFNYYNVH